MHTVLHTACTGVAQVLHAARRNFLSAHMYIPHFRLRRGYVLPRRTSV